MLNCGPVNRNEVGIRHSCGGMVKTLAGMYMTQWKGIILV